jgi:hypothetical protein
MILISAFFHSSHVWLVNKLGNPYGAPARFSDLKSKGIELAKEMPIGSK